MESIESIVSVYLIYSPAAIQLKPENIQGRIHDFEMGREFLWCQRNQILFR